MNGAQPGILMPGNPINGARYQQETAPGVAEDRGEIVGIEDSFEVEDLVGDETREYENPLGNPYDPVLDTGAFSTCP